MKRKFKLILLVALTASLFVGCGKDNAEEGQTTNVNSPIVNNSQYGYNSPIVNTTSTSWADFKNKVVAGSFAAIVGYQENYIYGSCSTSESKFLGFIPVNSTSCTQDFERNVFGTQIIHEFGSTESAIKAQLKTIIQAASDSSSSYKMLSSSSYQFISGEYIYTFNLAYPAAANPVSRAHVSTGINYYLMDVQSYSL